MPLPPLPANNTDRAWIKYTSMGIEHEMVVRFPPATTQANIITACQSLASGLASLMDTTDSFIGLRHQDSGSTLSFPLSWTTVAGGSAFTQDSLDEAKFIAVSGRSLGGYRCKLTLFTGVIPDSAGYRINVGESVEAADFLAALAAMPTAPVAVDGLPVIWNQYTNLGFNSYWQRKRR